ncbi:hypothetical protein ACP3V3_02485 [Vibrio sp. PNB22_3_1]
MRDQLIQFAEMVGRSLLLLDGLDSALVGYQYPADGEWILPVYSVDLIIDELMAQGESYLDAMDWYHYNVDASYGAGTPIFVHTEVVS